MNPEPTIVRLITINDGSVTVGDAWTFDDRDEAISHADDMSIGDNQVIVLSDPSGVVADVRQS